MYSQKDMHITLPNMHKKWVIQKIFILLNFYLKWEKSFFKNTDPAINIRILFCSIIYHWKDPDLSLKRPWCQEKLKAGGEANDRGWDGWMASLTQWTWIWVNSGSWWWTGRPGVLQSMGSQRVGHNWATELNWDWNWLESGWGLILALIRWGSWTCQVHGRHWKIC